MRFESARLCRSKDLFTIKSLTEAVLLLALEGGLNVVVTTGWFACKREPEPETWPAVQSIA